MKLSKAFRLPEKIALCILPLLVICFESGMSQTVLDSSFVSPTSVNVSSGSQIVTVDLWVRNSTDSIIFVFAYLGHPDSAQASGFGALVQGNSHNGKWEASLDVMSNVPVGTYPVYAQIYDAAFNILTANTGKTVQVAGGDTTPPSLDGAATISPASIDVFTGPKPDTVIVPLQDNSSGVNYALADFKNGSGASVASTFASLVSGDSMHGTWQAIVTIPQNADATLYLFIRAIDRALNSADLSTGVVLHVTGTDTIPPGFTGPAVINPNSVNVSSGPQDVTVTASVHDNRTGVADVTLHLVDSSSSSIAGYPATRISGDSLNGQWRAVLTVPAETPAETLTLVVEGSDVAGNRFNVSTGQTVQVLRNPESLVTFRVDLRRLYRLGLFSPLEFAAIVQIFSGPNAGVYALDDFDADSVWTLQRVIVVSQTIQYAFAIEENLNRVYELNGMSGGRSLTIPSTSPIILPIVTFDNLPVQSVDTSFVARVTRTFAPGNPPPEEFTFGATETFVTLDFATLDRAASVGVRRYAKASGGSAPPGIATIASSIFWATSLAPQGTTYSARLAMEYNLFGGVTDPTALRLLRREGAGQPWTAVPTELDLDNQTISGNGIDSLSEWTIGSTSSANTLVGKSPGIAASPNPLNGDSQVARNRELSWSPPPATRRYDIYLWKSTDTIPSTPTATNLRAPRYQPAVLSYSTTYHWRVVAKNLAGTTSGPTWSFTTESVADLVVSQVELPPTSYSGQSIDVKWKVTNIGSSITNPSRWHDAVYLSIDSVLIFREDPRLGAFENPNYLNPGESYFNSATVRLPDGIFGQYNIIVDADGYLEVPEFDETNNLLVKSLNITLTPPPDLQITALQSTDNAFSGQSVNVTYTVKNTGSGSAVSSSWVDAIFISSDSVLDTHTDTLLLYSVHNGPLLPDSAYTQTTSVTLPQGISGTYYLFAYGDYTNKVYEYTLENNNTRLRPVAITLAPPPDLVVTGVVVPTTGSSGNKISVQWFVQNQGPGIASGRWSDRVLISKVSTFIPDSATSIGSFTHIGSLHIDSVYSQIHDVTLPNGISGSYYVYVQTDWMNDVFEHIYEGNNVTRGAASMIVNLSPWPDLHVTTIQTPVGAMASDLISMTWTVANQGTGAITAALWKDSVFLSPGAVWDSLLAVPVASEDLSGDLGASASYSKTRQIRLPMSLSTGTYYVFVKADAQSTIYEHTDEGNNISRSNPLSIQAYPPVDLAVTAVSAQDSGFSGKPISVQYSVTNIGTGTTPVSGWTDLVFLSVDTALDLEGDIFVTRIQRSGPLDPGMGYDRNLNIKIPDGVSGTYYLIVETDSANEVNDVQTSNNVRHASSRIAITLTPSPDLQMTSMTAPASAQSGQPVKIYWSVQNKGVGAASGKWYDAVYLSENSVLEFGDRKLGFVEHNGALAVNDSYAESLEVQIPRSASGVQYLFVQTDSRDDIYEHGAETNNAQNSLITLTLPPPADLVVTNVSVPSNAAAGEYVTIDWTIRNQGSNPASGSMSEAVYFSSDTAWDINDPLVGVVTRKINLSPGASSAMQLKADLSRLVFADSMGSVTGETPGVMTGNYYAIVRTNIRNNIRETDLTNNRHASSNTLSVDVRILPVGVLTADSISGGEQEYFRVDVPGNVDLRLRATSSQSPPTLDAYVAYGKIPNSNSYDFRNDDPVAQTREVFVPSTRSGSYFVLVRSQSSPALDQFTIIAETLAFSLSSVQPAIGGMGGTVTGLIRGAGFRDSTRIFLYRGGTEVAEGKVRNLTSSMELAVRWDLHNISLGTYDVVARNTSGSAVVLSNGFQVEPARELTVGIGRTTPRVMLVNRRETYMFRFTNTSNIDIPYLVAVVAVPLLTEVQVSASDRLIKRSRLVPDSMVASGSHIEDYVDAATGRFIPFIARDMAPGEAMECRVVLRNSSYASGSNFPLFLGVRTLDKSVFLSLQLSNIEALRNRILANPSLVTSEVSAKAYDSKVFARYILAGYVSLGLVDQEDTVFVGGALTSDRGAARAVSASFVLATPVGKLPARFVMTSACEEFFNKLGCAASIGDCFIPLPLPPIINYVSCAIGVSGCFGVDTGLLGCFGILSAITCILKEVICKNIVSSLDPNEMVGPEGYGDRRWVAITQTLPYRIQFENDPKKATAPAQRVTVTHVFDSTVDMRTFRLGSFGFANHTFEIPGNPSFYSGRLDLRDSLGIYVDVTAGIDLSSGKAFWTFKSIDPLTGDLPNDPLVGLLPVDDSTGRGNGFVSYTIRPKLTSHSGDSVRATARIVFDQNDPLDTPPVFNTIDAHSPQSRIRPLPPTTTITSFIVHWGGTDDSTGSNIKSFSIYVSRDDSQYVAWLTNVTDTAAVFTGVANSHYKFFSLATDFAGNIEPSKLTPDADTRILTGVGEKPNAIPREYALHQNYPNPFNPSTTIRYDLPKASHVTLKVYSVLGQEVAVLVDVDRPAGAYSVQFGTGRLASGVYFYRMLAGTFAQTKKLVLLR